MEFIMEGTVREIIEYTGQTKEEFYEMGGKPYKKRRSDWKKEESHYIGVYPALYSYSRDGELIAEGTIDEIAEISGLKKSTIRYYASDYTQTKDVIKRIREREVVAVSDEEVKRLKSLDISQ